MATGLVVSGAACGPSGDEGPADEAVSDAIGQPAAIDSILDDDPRLGERLTVLDLRTNAERSDIAQVLNWSAGGADDLDCSYFFRGFDGDHLASGIGVMGVRPPVGDPTPLAAIGQSLYLCVADQFAAVEMISPSGATFRLPTKDGGSSLGPGFQVLRTEESSEADLGEVQVHDPNGDRSAAEYEIRSYPGAEVGWYRFEVEGENDGASVEVRLDDQASINRRYITSGEDDYLTVSKIFDFDRYRFGIENPPAEVGDVAKFGLIGFPPSRELDVAIYASRDEADATTIETTEPPAFDLTGVFSISTDDRGEATIVFELPERLGGHCLWVLTVEDAEYLADSWEQSPGAYATGNVLDPGMMCVAA